MGEEMRAGGRELAVYNILSDGSFIMVPCLHVKSRDERDFFPNLEKMPCRHWRRWGEEEPSSFPGLQHPWGLELRFMHNCIPAASSHMELLFPGA